MSEQDWQQMEADEKAMSETPRTDAAILRYTGGEPVTFPKGINYTVDYQFAQQLERESDALRRKLKVATAEIEAHRGGKFDDSWARQCEHNWELESSLAAAQKKIERQEARITVLRSGLLLIAGSGCEGEDPEQLCKDFELQMTSFCIPCKAAYFLELDDKPPAIAQAKGAE